MIRGSVVKHGENSNWSYRIGPYVNHASGRSSDNRSSVSDGPRLGDCDLIESEASESAPSRHLRLGIARSGRLSPITIRTDRLEICG